MFHTLCAKALLLVVEFGFSTPQAADDVVFYMPAQLKKAMVKHITAEVDLIVYGEVVIDLDEVVPEERCYVL